MSDWYDKQGRQVTTVPKAKGKGTTVPTLTHARKLGLIPRVSAILAVLNKPQLNDWRDKQITAAALRTPPMLDEAEESYHSRLMEEAFRQVDQAADAGTIIHEGAELALQGLAYEEEKPVYLPQLDETYPLKTFVRRIEEFVKVNEIETTAHELKLVNLTDGYAGTTDVAMRSKRGFGILDFKSKKTKPGKAVTPYDGQAMQIAAYHVAHYHSIPEPESHVVGANVFISTTEPGRVDACWYTAEQLEREWQAFQCCLKLWRHMKKFDPRQS